MTFFRRKKEKSLEEIARGKGLILNASVPPVGYDSFEVKGSGGSLEMAKVHLSENARKGGAKYMSPDIGEPRRSRTVNGFLYTYTTRAYRAIEPPNPAV